MRDTEWQPNESHFDGELAASVSAFPKLDIYIDLLSQPCRFLLLYLKLTLFPHTVHLVRIARGDHKRPPISQLNPEEKLPTVALYSQSAPSPVPPSATPLHAMGESVAIIRLVNRIATAHRSTHPAVADNVDLWCPKCDPERAQVDEILDFYHNTLRVGCGLITQRYIFRLPVRVTLRDDPLLSYGVKLFLDALRRIERILEKATWVARTSAATIADLVCATEIYALHLGGPVPFFDIARDYPRVSMWLGHISQLQHFEDVHKPFNYARQKIAEKVTSYSVRLAKL